MGDSAREGNQESERGIYKEATPAKARCRRLMVCGAPARRETQALWRSRKYPHSTSFPTSHGIGSFQVVEEGWLVRWRKFVLGRGARRYHAPGEMDNWPLLVGPNSPRKVSGPCCDSKMKLFSRRVWSLGMPCAVKGKRPKRSGCEACGGFRGWSRWMLVLSCKFTAATVLRPLLRFGDVHHVSLIHSSSLRSHASYVCHFAFGGSHGLPPVARNNYESQACATVSFRGEQGPELWPRTILIALRRSFLTYL